MVRTEGDIERACLNSHCVSFLTQQTFGDHHQKATTSDFYISLISRELKAYAEEKKAGLLTA